MGFNRAPPHGDHDMLSWPASVILPKSDTGVPSPASHRWLPITFELGQKRLLTVGELPDLDRHWTDH